MVKLKDHEIWEWVLTASEAKRGDDRKTVGAAAAGTPSSYPDDAVERSCLNGGDFFSEGGKQVSKIIGHGMSKWGALSDCAMALTASASSR